MECDTILSSFMNGGGGAWSSIWNNLLKTGAWYNGIFCLFYRFNFRRRRNPPFNQSFLILFQFPAKGLWTKFVLVLLEVQVQSAGYASQAQPQSPPLVLNILISSTCTTDIICCIISNFTRSWYVACIDGNEPGLAGLRVLNILKSESYWDVAMNESGQRVNSYCKTWQHCKKCVENGMLLYHQTLLYSHTHSFRVHG